MLEKVRKLEKVGEKREVGEEEEDRSQSAECVYVLYVPGTVWLYLLYYAVVSYSILYSMIR